MTSNFLDAILWGGFPNPKPPCFFFRTFAGSQVTKAPRRHVTGKVSGWNIPRGKISMKTTPRDHLNKWGLFIKPRLFETTTTQKKSESSAVRPPVSHVLFFFCFFCFLQDFFVFGFWLTMASVRWKQMHNTTLMRLFTKPYIRWEKSAQLPIKPQQPKQPREKKQKNIEKTKKTKKT